MVSDNVKSAMYLLAGMELTPEEYLWATRYLQTRVRWPSGQKWVLVDVEDD